jgi:nitrite reductase/ring-hydroxylating ferredoxin subunit
MISTFLNRAIESIPGLKEGGGAVASSIHRAILDGGPPVRNVVDLLHGTWLGHPLHPVLTDIPVGAWSMAILFDSLAGSNDSRFAERAADTLTAIGTIAAVPTAVTGLADYQAIARPGLAPGALHGLLNTIGLLLYIASLQDRRNGRRGRGVLFSSLAYGLLLLSAWIGGDLVYNHRIGVNHNHPIRKPQEWTAIMDETDLPESRPMRVEVEGEPVLLYRRGGTVYAIGAICAHAGAPLEEGTFYDLCVQCPWHDSVYDLRDGSVVHGPSTYPQPNYAARIQNGRVEVRLKRG